MLRVQVGEKEIEVRFDHKVLEPYEIEGLTGKVVEEERRCSVVKVSVDHQEFIGVAICHPADNFCKSIGRKRAMRDALIACTKDERTAVWEAYQCRNVD